MSKTISSEQFFPVINDDVISLSWKYKFDAMDINKEEEACFDIVLNDTKEIVGEISFNYFLLCGFSYRGNVGYHIDKDFQNKHYGTRALGLLKKLLINNEYSGDKTLYISTAYDNVKSQAVITNNSGVLFYDGEVPRSNPINFIEGIKKVKVYKIEM